MPKILTRNIQHRVASAGSPPGLAGRRHWAAAGALVILTGTALAAMVPTAAAPARATSSSSARTPWPGGTWRPDLARYGVGARTNVPVKLQDGTTLVGDVYYPTVPHTGKRAIGKFPVLLAQDPYLCQSPQGAAEVMSSNGLDYFVQRGYLYVIVCLRGTGRSGGTFDMLSPTIGADGVQVVDWTAHDLAGSDGRVGGIGCSYLGITQLMTAAAIGPDSPLKAIAPMGVSADELYDEGISAGGMPSTLFQLLPDFLAEIGPRGQAWGKTALADIAAGGSLAYNSQYWRQRAQGNFVARAERDGIPALMWFGWNDIVTTGGPNLYTEYQNATDHRPVNDPMTPGQRVTGRDQVVIGPWNHCQGIDPALELEWYDTWLKGEPTGIAATRTPMHLYDLGTSSWTNAATWPLASRYTSFYLGDGGQLTRTKPATPGSTALRWAQPRPAAPDTMRIFTSAPLKAPATIAGPVSASIYASSSSKNMQLIVQLDEVAPDGKTTEITAGSLVASLRALSPGRTWYDARGTDIRPQPAFRADQYLTPGRPVRLDFSLSPRVVSIRRGDSLRVIITTQTPAAECIPAPQDLAHLSNELPCVPTPQQKATLPGTYTIEHSSAMPSAVNIPLLPPGTLNPAGNGPEPLNWG
jgi:predicted acyl esterase